MFHLQERQLHIIVLLILIAGGVCFFLFGTNPIPEREGGQILESLDDFSDGWLYHTKQDAQVVSFPVELDAKAGNTFTYSHRAPDMTSENQYMVIKADRLFLQVKVADEVIFESSGKDIKNVSYYVIPILPEYNNRSISLVYQRLENETITIPTVAVGTKTQLYGQVLQDNLGYVLWGSLLILICLFSLGSYALIQNTDTAKRVLLYGSLEGIVLGVLGIFQGSMIPILTGWNYGTYIVRVCFVIVLAILYLLVLRCLTYKKRVISLLDIGAVVCLVFFISVMVLHFFDLIQLDTIDTMAKWLYGILIVGYTCIFGVSVMDYHREESRPVLYGNVALVICMVLQIIMQVVGRDLGFHSIFLLLGFTIYELFILVLGMKKALFVAPKKEKASYNEEEVRRQLLEQINPNLLFASFHTLQNLIKSGSGNSVKMIYYISVYFRNNLKALEHRGDTIPFSEELEHILAYLQLQKIRNGNLKFALECKITDFQVPRHSIEPMVENAVKHGIGGNQNTGNVVVRTYLRAEGYAVQVIDDGIGFHVKELQDTGDTSLVHLVSILEKTCNAQVEMISHEGKGTVITIVLPMLENDLMDEIEELDDKEELDGNDGISSEE